VHEKKIAFPKLAKKLYLLQTWIICNLTWLRLSSKIRIKLISKYDIFIRFFFYFFQIPQMRLLLCCLFSSPFLHILLVFHLIIYCKYFRQGHIDLCSIVEFIYVQLAGALFGFRVFRVSWLANDSFRIWTRFESWLKNPRHLYGFYFFIENKPYNYFF
jgi:hypothetical protein